MWRWRSQADMADNLRDIWDGKHRKKKRKEGGGYWEKSWV